MLEPRRIPRVMFSQHPDNAQKPFWHDNAFVSTHHEIEECYLMFKDLGAEEMMWDWEGKLADESVIERLLGQHFEFFEQNPIGEKLFLTLRVPNPRIESGYRLGRAFMVILSGQEFACAAGFSTPPLFEIILPMAEGADEMLLMQKNFELIAGAVNYSFGSNGSKKSEIEIIPTFESIETILKSADILRDYVNLFSNHYKTKPAYLRPFCARSDPALNSGIVPTTLAIKWALSQYAGFTAETGIITYPIIAAGSLPFRGGFRPDTVNDFMNEYQGMRTLVVQSSFRYDYPFEDVKRAVNQIATNLNELQTEILPQELFQEIKTIIPMFEIPYRKMVEKIAHNVLAVSGFIPQRRERVQHIGLFGYSRELRGIKLPRAIGFTASCYSLGIPPELFGLGKGIEEAERARKMSVVESLYKNFKQSILSAGGFLRKESLVELGLLDFCDEIKIIEKYLGEELGPKIEREKEHSEFVQKIILSLKNGGEPRDEIEQAAILRQSLG